MSVNKDSVGKTIHTLLKWKEEGSHKGDLADLRRMDVGSLQVLAKLGVYLRNDWLKAWQLLGYLASLGIKDDPQKGCSMFSSEGIKEERMRQILGSKDLADSLRRTAGMLKKVDYKNVFWSVVYWGDPLKKKKVQADWWMSYYGGKDVSDENKDQD